MSFSRLLNSRRGLLSVKSCSTSGDPAVVASPGVLAETKKPGSYSDTFDAAPSSSAFGPTPSETTGVEKTRGPVVRSQQQRSGSTALSLAVDGVKISESAESLPKGKVAAKSVVSEACKAPLAQAALRKPGTFFFIFINNRRPTSQSANIQGPK